VAAQIPSATKWEKGKNGTKKQATIWKGREGEITSFIDSTFSQTERPVGEGEVSLIGPQKTIK